MRGVRFATTGGHSGTQGERGRPRPLQRASAGTPETLSTRRRSQVVSQYSRRSNGGRKGLGGGGQGGELLPRSPRCEKGQDRLQDATGGAVDGMSTGTERAGGTGGSVGGDGHSTLASRPGVAGLVPATPPCAQGSSTLSAGRFGVLEVDRLPHISDELESEGDAARELAVGGGDARGRVGPRNRGAASRGKDPPWVRRKRRKAAGSLIAHVRFLQYLFRKTRVSRAGSAARRGCWSRGGMRRLWWLRPPTVFGCQGGATARARERLPGPV